MAHDSRLILTCDTGSTDLAERELSELAPSYEVLATLAPGVLLIDGHMHWRKIAAAWSATPPIFVRHICPVQLAEVLTADVEDIERIATAILGADRGDPLIGRVVADMPLSVQTRVLAELPYKPFDINKRLAATIAETVGAPIDVRAPQQVLSVVCADLSAHALGRFGLAAEIVGGESRPVALVGLSATAENISDWAGGMRRFAREPGQISRAEFKLLEALEVFQIALPPHGVALDLGASPGGWTRVLRQRDQYVTAVDPGQLDERLLSDRAVRHLAMTAEEYLRNEPDRFDVIVNDMRMDARDSARLMVTYAGQLYPHGFVIMTLKLPEAKRGPILVHARNILRERYVVVGARQLFHNRSEITLYLKPK